MVLLPGNQHGEIKYFTSAKKGDTITQNSLFAFPTSNVYPGYHLEYYKNGLKAAYFSFTWRALCLEVYLNTNHIYSHSQYQSE